jgi:hypothetical protein
LHHSGKPVDLDLAAPVEVLRRGDDFEDPVFRVRFDLCLNLHESRRKCHGRGDPDAEFLRDLERNFWTANFLTGDPARQYVEQQVKRDVRQDEDRDPIADVMISGLRAAATLKDESLKPSVTTLSQQDRSMKVRQAALEALKVMG